METNGRRKFPWLAILLAAGVLIALSCGIAATLGTGAFFWLTQRTAESSEPVSVQSSSSTIPQAALLTPGRGLVEFKGQAGNWTSVKGETPVSEGDQIRSGALSSAQVNFPDGSMASLGSDTEITVEELDFKSGKQIVRLSQSKGESRHEVASKDAGQLTYSVRTPGGSGEARGTIFQVAITPDQAARFIVEEGSLAVTGQQETVMVEAGQTSIVYADEPPTEPVLRISGEGAVTQTGDTWIIAGQSFSIHENTFIIGSPQVGDLVHVEGRLLADNTRLADLIVLLRASPANQFTLTGVVEGIEQDTWTVAGQEIEIGDNAEIDPGIQVGDWVRVEGLILEGGALQARRIVLYGEENRLPFEFSGVVETISADSWTISGVIIAVDGNTTIDGTPAPGDIVRVSGWVQEDLSWLADHIRLADPGERAFEIAGRIESMDPWRIAGITFETRQWTEIDPGLQSGDLVRVEGRIQEDGTWVAYEIERIQDAPYPLIVIIGTVISTDPWVVSGIPLNVTPETFIEGDITPGMLVRVEIYLLPDGTWRVIRITSLEVFIGIPGCLNLTATVVSYDGTLLHLYGWPELRLGEDVKIDGELKPNSVVAILLCFDEQGKMVIVQIIIILQPEPVVEPPPELGDKVTICHKPLKKKGGNTITIARPALPAHLAHGDYIGACSR